VAAKPRFFPYLKQYKILVLLFVCCATTNNLSIAQMQSQSGESLLHSFKLWGLMASPVEKLDIYVGFTNGFFFGPRSPKFVTLLNCVEKNIPSAQAIAMIDKYYKENPQRWGMPLGQEVVAALTVKDGPCPGIDPWSK
jgi:hypothetical protein